MYLNWVRTAQAHYSKNSIIVVDIFVRIVEKDNHKGVNIFMKSFFDFVFNTILYIYLDNFKFIFSKKATKIDQIFTYLVNVKSTVKTFSFFLAFLENINCTRKLNSSMKKFELLRRKKSALQIKIS